MKGTYCDRKGGWTRVGYLNMTESNATCPSGLTKTSFTTLIMEYVVDQPLMVLVVSQLCFLF